TGRLRSSAALRSRTWRASLRPMPLTRSTRAWSPWIVSSATGSASRDARTASVVGIEAADDHAAGFLVVLQLQQLARGGLLQELPERAEAVVALVEAGLAPLERLLDHRAPDLLVGGALGE